MIETEAPQSVDEKALVRARWLTELRPQGHRRLMLDETHAAVEMNDGSGGYPFAEIADVVEGWFR
jgi:hypothetical protein